MGHVACPACQGELILRDGRCAACNTEMPWSQQVNELRVHLDEQFKERESNRGRATLTLIEDLLATAKGERPMSLASLKGFVFAWMFPRALVVLGSVVGTIVLALQTLILYNQTRLLDEQASAARVEMVEHIRSRMASLSLKSVQLKPLLLEFPSSFDSCHEPACRQEVSTLLHERLESMNLKAGVRPNFQRDGIGLGLRHSSIASRQFAIGAGVQLVAPTCQVTHLRQLSYL